MMLKHGIYGVDIHKEEKPKVAEMGGIVMIFTIVITCVITIFLVPRSEDKVSIMIFCMVVSIAAIVGFIDDIKPLNAILKPVLLLFASIPIIISKRYRPEPILPFIGRTRLTIVYLILLPFVISVPANAVNMLDVFNGSMASTVIILLITILISRMIIFGINFNDVTISTIFILIIIGTLIGFWIYNRYPAKIFAGDTGSLSIGAAIGTIAVMGELEIVTIIAMIPFIMNSFGIISSLKGFVERRDMPARPTEMTSDWKIKASDNPRAPITLVGLILQKGPLRENDIVKGFNILSIFSGILAVVTAILIRLVI